MTLQLHETTTFELGGNSFEIRKLTFAESIAVYVSFQKLVTMFLDEDKADGLSLFQIAGMSGQLDQADLEKYIRVFGEATTATFADGRVLKLKKVPAAKGQPEVDPMSDLFSGKLEDMFVWLDLCAEYNFGSLIAKMRGALKNVPDARAEGSNPAAA